MNGLSISRRTVVAILPYVCSVAGILVNGYWSNKTGERRWHMAIPILMTGAALSLAILAGDRVPLVIALLGLLGFTFQAYLPPFWTLPTAYLGRRSRSHHWRHADNPLVQRSAVPALRVAGRRQQAQWDQ